MWLDNLLENSLVLLVPLLLKTNTSVVSATKDVYVARYDAYDTTKSTRIIGGEEAEYGRHPYAVSIQSWGTHFCGGTLIAKDVVLTAAHCFTNTIATNTQAVVGRTDITTSDEGEVIPVVTAVVHELFDRTGTWEYDFALLFLAWPTTATTVQLMDLNTNETFPESGAVGTVMGWGDLKEQSDKYEASDILMTVETGILSNEECSLAQGKLDGYNGDYNDLIYPSMICTMSEKQNACKGDSGGPLVIQGEDSMNDVQVGVVSWSMPAGCATKVFPNVYSRVSSGIDWMKQHVCAMSADPPNRLCGTPNPTDNPTESPTTPAPSESPTPGPTQAPSIEPTESPTKQPTEEPSRNPTSSPTESPTLSPSFGPSSSPSLSPTISFQPSFIPSEIPSVSPSSIPSMVPSLTTKPSFQPTSSPSISANPTGGPTISPTVSAAPSFEPTNSPTVSNAPTTSSAPTLSTVPTYQPTNVPSLSHSPTSSSQPTATNAPTEEEVGVSISISSLLPDGEDLAEEREGTEEEEEVVGSIIAEELTNGSECCFQIHSTSKLIMLTFTVWALL